MQQKQSNRVLHKVETNAKYTRKFNLDDMRAEVSITPETTKSNDSLSKFDR